MRALFAEFSQPPHGSRCELSQPPRATQHLAPAPSLAPYFCCRHSRDRRLGSILYTAVCVLARAATRLRDSLATNKLPNRLPRFSHCTSNLLIVSPVRRRVDPTARFQRSPRRTRPNYVLIYAPTPAAAQPSPSCPTHSPFDLVWRQRSYPETDPPLRRRPRSSQKTATQWRSPGSSVH